METNPFPSKYMSDIEYSIIMSNVIKSFDCILKRFKQRIISCKRCSLFLLY